MAIKNAGWYIAAAVVVILLVLLLYWAGFWSAMNPMSSGAYTVATLVLATMSLIAVFVFGKHSFGKEAVIKEQHIVWKGLYISNFWSNFILRPLISIAGGSGIMLLVGWISYSMIGTDALVDNPALLNAGAVIAALAIGWNNQHDIATGRGSLTVPNDHVAIVTWLDNRLPVYLTEGDHGWVPTFLGFGINRTPLHGTNNKKDALVGPEQGLVYVGTDPIDIRNSANDKKNPIENVTYGGSSVFATYLVTVVVTNPLRYASINDPILRIAEQARAGLRKAFAYFHDRDITSLKDVISSLTVGEAIGTAFTSKGIEHYPEGSIVRNRAGNLLTQQIDTERFEEVDQLSSEDEMALTRAKRIKLRQEKKNHEEDIKDQIAKEMEDWVADRAHARYAPGSYSGSCLRIAEKLLPVIEDCGCKLVDTTIGNITLTAAVSAAAQEAESATFKRQTTLNYAQAQKDAREILQPKEGESTDEMTRVIAALQSNPENVNLVYVPGGDSFTKAAATHASVGKKNDGGQKK